jgi:hypothetical protein
MQINVIVNAAITAMVQTKTWTRRIWLLRLTKSSQTA